MELRGEPAAGWETRDHQEAGDARWQEQPVLVTTCSRISGDAELPALGAGGAGARGLRA